MRWLVTGGGKPTRVKGISYSLEEMPFLYTKIPLYISRPTFIPDKPFKSYKQQIGILQSRGLFIDDASFAKHMLRTYSYYDLINGNLDELMVSRHPDRFVKNTSLADLVQIRFMEDRIKAIFLKQILMIEKTFKSTLSYYISEQFGVDSNPGGYLTKKNYSGDRADVVKKTMKTLRDVRDGNVHKPQGEPIRHYRKDHNHIPPWILIDELTFGETVYWYKCLDNQGKLEVSSEMLHLPQEMSSTHMLELFQIVIDLIREFRNFFAHNSVLSHMKSKRKLKIKLIGDVNSSDSLVSGITDNLNNSRNLLACFLSILLLSKDPDQLKLFLLDFQQTEEILDSERTKFIIEDIFQLPLEMVERGLNFVNDIKD